MPAYTLTVDDGNGNQTQANFNLNVLAAANTPATGSPVITGTTNIGQTLSVDTSSIADADGLGTFSYQWIRDGADVLGATNSTYTLTVPDNNSNISVRVSFVDGLGYSEALTSSAVGPVNDVTAPVITLTGPSVVNLTQGDTYTEQGATWTDNVDGSGAAVVGGDTVDTNTVGSYTVRYNYTDAAGNAATEVTRLVNVSLAPDTTPPVITLNGSTPITLEAGQNYVEQGATWTDDRDGSGTAIVSGDTVNNLVPGSYTIDYDYTDLAGNAATTVQRVVNVVDTTGPSISIQGGTIVYHLVNTPYTDAGATASDIVDGDLTGSIVTTGLPIDTATLGNYTVTYTVTDAAGNTSQRDRTVRIVTELPNTGANNENMIRFFRNATGLNSYCLNELAIAYYKQEGSTSLNQYNDSQEAAQIAVPFVGTSPIDWRN